MQGDGSRQETVERRIQAREEKLPAFFDDAPAPLKPSKGLASGVLGAAAGAIIAALSSSPLTAAEVTFERVKNAESEPGNWLTNHKTYDGRRFSTLDQINQSNI
jgi:glucose dehydrogenase